MAALREALALLTNPTPVFQDPEDNEDDTNAKVVSKAIEDEEDNEEVSHVSSLRRKTALTTADFGEKYAGKKTSRKKLSHFGESDDELESDDEDEQLFDDPEIDDSDSELESENNEEDDEDEEDIKSFQIKISQVSQPTKPSFSFTDDGDFSKYVDMENDEDNSEEGEDESDEDDNDDSEESGDDGYEEDIDESINDNEEVNRFSKADVSLEIEKGNAAKAQLGIWDSLLENRIKLQKVVGLVNQLPQPDTWGMFVDNSERGDRFTETSLTAQVSLQNLLDKLLQLQTVLLLQNIETRHIPMGTDVAATSDKERSKEDDEEITSESETEEANETLKSLIQKVGVKRKLKLDDYSETLTKRHKDFVGFRNTAIQRWYDRTRLVSGKVNSKSFSSFDQSALKQIEQILGDKERLIRRTQLKRSVFRVLGIAENTDKEETTPDTKNPTDLDNLKNYDSEIFDDSDFYHQQLRELIERKAADTDNPVALSRHWLEIQKMRKRVKKNVDTKASKGRKTRYEVHKKLINFMAPKDQCSWTDESRDDLFKSLFGKRLEQSLSAPGGKNTAVK